MQISKWGNSLAVRLPATVVEALQLKEGDDIEIEVLGERHFGVRQSQRLNEVLERLRRFRGRLPADFKFDRLEANERAVSSASGFDSEPDAEAPSRRKNRP